MDILVIDNIDSFVYNLVQYLGEEGANPIVLDNTAAIGEIEDIIKEKDIQRIVISPGPKRPEDAGVSNEVIKEFGRKIPTLGVCLGHQCIGHVFDGKIRRAKTLRHGKTSMISHNREDLLHDLPNPFVATRYHSLVVDDRTLPDCLETTAISNDDMEIMGLRHRKYPLYGVQFHPESILTVDGKKIIKNFLNLDF